MSTTYAMLAALAVIIWVGVLALIGLVAWIKDRVTK